MVTGLIRRFLFKSGSFENLYRLDKYYPDFLEDIDKKDNLKLLQKYMNILTSREKEIIEKANLKETSLHQLALKCDIQDTTKFVNKFIDYDRRVR